MIAFSSTSKVALRSPSHLCRNGGRLLPRASPGPSGLAALLFSGQLFSQGCLSSGRPRRRSRCLDVEAAPAAVAGDGDPAGDKPPAVRARENGDRRQTLDGFTHCRFAGPAGDGGVSSLKVSEWQ